MPNADNLLPPWKPGQSGNPKGRPKKKPFAEVLEQMISQEPEALESVVKAALTEASNGNVQAQKMISEILDGKPTQQVEAEVTGNVTLNYQTIYESDDNQKN